MGILPEAWIQGSEPDETSLAEAYLGTGRFGVVANWGPVGLPAAHWKATLNNDLSSTERTAEVTTDQTVDAILVSGTTGAMRLQIEAGVMLSVANGLTVEAGGIVGGDGTIEGDVTIGSGGGAFPRPHGRGCS